MVSRDGKYTGSGLRVESGAERPGFEFLLWHFDTLIHLNHRISESQYSLFVKGGVGSHRVINVLVKQRKIILKVDSWILSAERNGAEMVCLNLPLPRGKKSSESSLPPPTI